MRRIAVAFMVGGIVCGYGAFSIDYQMRITTLHEEMVQGSIEVQPGDPAPVRTVSFTVEHPGVPHELFVSPTSDLIQQAMGTAEVMVSLASPTGEMTLPETKEQFSVRAEARSARTDWEGRTFHFTPTAAGKHTVRVTPLTIGIPKIQVRIKDPQKKDGQRMAGY